MDEEKKEMPQEAPAAPTANPQASVDVSKIIEDLKAQGLSEEQIIPALEKMAQEGKMSPEDLEKAKELLNQSEEQEAEKLFGMKFIK